MFADTTAELQETIDQREARLFWLALAFLLLIGGTLSLSRISDGDALLDSMQHLVVLPVWGASVWLVRRFAMRANPTRDPLLLPIVFLLVGWGMLIVWRLAPGLGARQTGWFLVGTLAMVEVLRSSPALGWLRRYRYVWLSVGIGLTALTLILGTNPAGGEPRLWLGCCGIYLQPSEPLRLLLIAFVASYLGDQMLVERPRRWARELLPLILAGALSGVLLLAQRDLGAGMLFLAVLAFMVYIAFGHVAVLVGTLLLLVASGTIGYLSLDLVQTRLEAWLNPWADPTGAGYQIVQSVIAISSGGLLGAGPGMGAPGSVPVVQSDFVFSAVAEEWGLAGGLAMLALFALLVGRGLRTASRARDPFLVFLTGGVSIAIALQVLLIVGGVTRLLPITGVTLPLISYGGSSLVTSLMGIGFLVLLSRSRAGHLGVFSAPIARTHALLSLGWVACGLALGWWSIVRADTLRARTDNPRRALASLESLRGRILDRNEIPLAISEGMPGAYRRSYPLAEAASVVGYDSASFGQTGIESTMDAVLRGEAGPDPVAIWWHQLLYGVPPDGSDIRLTLDVDLQQQAADLLEGRTGAAVVLDPISGELLAVVSAPSFDPNLLAEQWSDLLQRRDAPLLNRATQGYYQPGMVLAPLLYAWAVSDGEIEPDQAPPDLERQVELFGAFFGCQRPVEPGSTPSWSAALQHACAGPFFALGEQLGFAGLESALTGFGLTDQPEIRLEIGPPPARESPARFEQLQLVGTAIGQGELVVTPLQIARAYSALAAAGVRPALRLVGALASPGDDWQPQAALGAEQIVVTPPASQMTIDALQALDPGAVGYAVTAVSGTRPATWFVAIESAQRVVVVVLEDASVVTAREIGLALLGR